MSVRSLVLLFLALAAFHGLGNWSLPLIDRDEPRFAEASREMRERGDYLVPRFNGEYRFDKPPLIYWLQCGAYAALGENDFAARLPSALCAAAIGVVLAIWGARLWDPATGWRAALIFSLCLQTIVHARAAVADMPMVLAVTLAAWAGWEWRTRGSPLACVAFWGALAVGFLAKGPIAWLPLGMLWWGGAPRPKGARREWPAWLIGAGAMLAIVALWGVPALLATHGEFARVGLGKHLVGRSVGAMEGHGSSGWLGYLATLPLYFVTVWLSFFPWSIWLPAALRGNAVAGGSYWSRRFPSGSVERYLAVGVVLCFAIFTLSRTKLPHYTLPCFPFLAMLLAAWWRDARTAALFQRTAICAAVAGAILFLVGFPLARSLFPAERLYAQAAPWLRPEMPLAMVEHHEPSVVWIFRRRLETFPQKLKPKDLAAWLAAPGARAVIVPGPTLAGLAPRLDPSCQIFRAKGWNVTKGHRTTLVLIVKPA